MVQELNVIGEKKLTNATVRLLADDIFHIKWKPGIDMEIPDIDELAKTYEEYSKGKQLKVIQELDHFTNISNDARKYAAEKAPLTAGTVYIVKGLSQRMVLKFYLNIRQAKSPTKVVSTFEEAIEWCTTS